MELVSLKSVAEKAAVSRSTAGLILNGRGDALGIRPDTQQRVRQVARELRYRPNYLARGLAGKSTRTVGVLWSFPPFHPHQMMRRELTMQLHKRGYQSFVADSLSDVERIEKDLGEFRRRGVDGLIMLVSSSLIREPAILQALESFPRKVLVSNESDSGLVERGWPFLHRDVAPAMEDLVEHLVAGGRTRPGIVVSSQGMNQPKLEAFHAALRRRGLPGGPEQVVDIGTFRAPAHEDFFDLFTAGLRGRERELSRFDALLFSCDEGAAAALALCRQRGIRVPEDLALIGYNNAPICKATDPPLASIEWKNQPTAEAVMEMIFRQFNEETLEGDPRRVPMSFRWRESAGEGRSGR